MRRKGSFKQKIIFGVTLIILVIVSVFMTKFVFQVVPTLSETWMQSIFFGILISLGTILALITKIIKRK